MRGTAVFACLVPALLLTSCGGETLTPGFPSEVTLSARLPQEPFLDFSLAVLTKKEVARGSVRFSVRVSEGGRSYTVHEEVVRARDGRGFQHRTVNLAAWRGREVTLTLAAGPAHPEAAGAWVEDVDIAWGEPRIENRPPEAPPRHPNIVLVLVDTLRRDYLGFHGFEGEISPNLDWLAKESVVFENAFSQAPWTKPSVASLFTAFTPDRHGLDNHEGLLGPRVNEALATGVLPAEAVTLAEALKAVGYRTAALVANPWLDARYGFDQGFDSYEIVETLPSMLERARGLVGEGPFFLYLHFMDVHGPYDAPEEDFEAMAKSASLDVRSRPGDRVELPAYLRGIPWFGDEEFESRGFDEVISFRLTRSHTVRARYAGNVRDFDRRIAPYLNEIRNSALNDSTMVVLTSDHGEELLEHGGFDHGFNLYDHQIRVPLLIRAPGARDSGRRVHQAANLVDVMPTLLALANAEVPKRVDGRNLFAADVTFEPSFSAATKHREGVRAVRTERYKLILDGKTGTASLFDLETDPAEFHDIAAADEATTKELLGLVSRHIDEASRSRLRPERAAIPDEIRKRLEALGYLTQTKQ